MALIKATASVFSTTNPLIKVGDYTVEVLDDGTLTNNTKQGTGQYYNDTPYYNVSFDSSGDPKSASQLQSAVTSVGATLPLISSGGHNPIISTQINTNKLVGRTTASAGVMEEITVGSGLLLAAGVLSSTDVGGTVTDVIGVNTNGFTWSIATSTTTPTITLTLQNATTSQAGQLTSADWNTFNNKQATLVSGTNIKTINSNDLLGAGDISVSTLIGYTPYNATNPSGYITASSTSTLTNKSGLISQWTNDSGYITSIAGAVTSVSGTANRITSSGGTTPVIDISGSYVGQSSITTLGTIATGVWQGTAVADAYISSATNWNTAYTNRITSLTTTGTSGAATLIANTLNIPQYTGFTQPQILKYVSFRG